MKTVDDWLVEIENGLLYRKTYGVEAAWPRLEGMYLNNPRCHTAVGPNVVFSMGDSLLSSLCMPSPEIVIQPERMTGKNKAPILEAVDNMLVRRTGLQRVVERATLHNFLFGRGIIKLGYDSEWGWSPYYDIGPKEHQMGLTMTQMSKKGELLEFNSRISPGMPWASVVHPQDFVVPWGTMEVDDAPWVAHRVVRLNTNLKKDPKYKNTSQLEPQLSMDAYMNSYQRVSNKRLNYRNQGAASANMEPLYNVLWEIRDRAKGEIIVITPDYGKFLRKEPDYIGIACGRPPFVSTSMVMHPRTFWVTPQAYYLMQIQKTQYDIALQAEKQRRINCLRFLASKNAVPKDEVDKALSQDVGAIAFADTNKPLKDVLTTFPTGTNYDLGYEASVNYRYARDAIGFSANQLGEFDTSTRRTKGEAMLVEAGSERRRSRRSLCVTDLYVDAVRMMNSIIFSWWKRPRDIFVDSEWTRFTGEYLIDDYSYDIALSTKRQLGMAERKIEALMLMSHLIQLPGVNIPELYKYVVEASGDAGFERIFAPTLGQGVSMPSGQGAAPALPGGQGAAI